MDEWLKIIGALGGLEAIRFTVTFLANRKTNARKEKATADSMELQNLLSIIDNLNINNHVSVGRVARRLVLSDFRKRNHIAGR